MGSTSYAISDIADPIECYLPEPSSTTFAFLVLLVRWSVASPRLCGVRLVSNREASRELLAALLAGAAAWQPMKIPVRLNN